MSRLLGAPDASSSSIRWMDDRYDSGGDARCMVRGQRRGGDQSSCCAGRWIRRGDPTTASKATPTTGSQPPAGKYCSPRLASRWWWKRRETRGDPTMTIEAAAAAAASVVCVNDRRGVGLVRVNPVRSIDRDRSLCGIGWMEEGGRVINPRSDLRMIPSAECTTKPSKKPTRRTRSPPKVVVTAAALESFELTSLATRRRPHSINHTTHSHNTASVDRSID